MSKIDKLDLNEKGGFNFKRKAEDVFAYALKKKVAKKMKLDKNDSDNLREYSRTDDIGRKFYRMPMGTYKRKGDRYVKED